RQGRSPGGRARGGRRAGGRRPKRPAHDRSGHDRGLSAAMRLWPRRQGSSLDLLVVGLGNPGREYARNRHNVGYLVADELARRHGGSWRSKFSGQLAEIRLDGHKVALLKPETYMNESGRSVGGAARFYKLEPGEILVVHDEGDFDLGRLELKVGGGLAGHNGLRSIAQQLKTQDFLRLRIG